MGDAFLIQNIKSDSTPTIVTQGLVLHLDAGNTSSYPGSGTTWFDLSGNNYHGNLTNYSNAPVFSTAYGGTFNFSNSARFFINIPLLNNTTSPYTVCWFGGDGAGDNFGGVSRDVDWQTGNHLIGWKSDAINTYTGTLPTFNTPTNSGFMMTGINRRPNNSTSFYYNDGNLIQNMNYTSFAARLTWTFGSRGNGAGHQYLGKMGVILIYNQILSVEEISQNFNALKSRFGL